MRSRHKAVLIVFFAVALAGCSADPALHQNIDAAKASAEAEFGRSVPHSGRLTFERGLVKFDESGLATYCGFADKIGAFVWVGDPGTSGHIALSSDPDYDACYGSPDDFWPA